MKRSLKKGLPGGPNEKVFSKEGYRSTSPDVNNLFNFIPSGNITMKEKDGTPLKKGPLLGIDNLGNSKLMLPGANYQFPGDFVKEVPLAKKGGPFQNSNIYATNKLFVKNPLFKKRKKGKKAKGIYNPKAKYTYDDGGESGCPEGFYNDPVKGCVAIEDPNTFYENWFQNRVMPTAEGQKLLDKIRPEALERSRESIPYIFNESLDPNEAGYYDVDTRQIMLNKFLPEAQIQATKYHERMHDIQAGDKFSNILEKPQGYLVEQNIIEPKAINTGNPEWDKNLKKNYEDIVDPNEIHARVMTLRRLAGFRPDQTISEKDLQDYFKAVKDSGGKLDPDIEDLKGVTKGNKAIVNLLNDMVSVPSNSEDLTMAQFGGPKGQCPIGYEWNGVQCVPNPFETRPSQRAAVYMDKDGNYQIDPAYQQYSQQKFDVAQSNKKAQDFNKMYAQSKNYKRLLKKQGYTPEEIEDRINSIMNINDIRYTDEGPSWVGANEDTGNEFISYNVTDPGDWPGFDQIAAHEWGHVGVDSGANPLKPKEREEFINRINKEQAGVTGNPDDLVHDMEPQENRADLLQLRQQLQEAGVFDSTKRKRFTKKDLNKYKEAMKSSERNWDNMWNRMFRLYDDDSIIYFMNNVAKNNSNEDLQVGKYGFELDLTEDEIQKYVKGGYVVEEDISVPSLTRMDDGGSKPKKDKWGRPETSKWYGFDPKTKKYTLGEFKGKTFKQREAAILNKMRNLPEVKKLNAFYSKPQSVQMIYPETYVIGPGGGALGSGVKLGLKTLAKVGAKSIPGLSKIPGATIGNAVASGFAADAIVNRIPEIPGQISEGNYLDALANVATAGLDIAGANMGTGLIDEIGKGINALPEAIQASKESGLLSNTYKLNPLAGKLNTYNRIVGQDAILDLQNSGLVRAGERGGVETNMGIRTSAYPSFGKGAPRQAYIDQTIQQGKIPYVISTDRPMGVSTLGRHGKGSTMFPIDETGKYMSAFSADEVRVFGADPHWLKGYKEVPVELPGSPNTSISDRLKQFFDRPPGPLMIGLGGSEKFTRKVPYPDYYLDIMKLNKYNSKQKKYFEDLIESVKGQGNVATERQYDELQRIKTGDYNYGKRGYAEGGVVSELTKKEIDKLIKQGYIIEEID